MMGHCTGLWTMNYSLCVFLSRAHNMYTLVIIYCRYQVPSKQTTLMNQELLITSLIDELYWICVQSILVYDNDRPRGITLVFFSYVDFQCWFSMFYFQCLFLMLIFDVNFQCFFFLFFLIIFFFKIFFVPKLFFVILFLLFNLSTNVFFFILLIFITILFFSPFFFYFDCLYFSFLSIFYSFLLKNLHILLW